MITEEMKAAWRRAYRKERGPARQAGGEARPRGAPMSTINEIVRAESAKVLATFLRPVDTLDLSARALCSLHNAGVRTVGDLVQRSEDELMRMRNFGRKSLGEVRHGLAAVNLSLFSRDDQKIAIQSRNRAQVTDLQSESDPQTPRKNPDPCADVHLRAEARALAEVAVHAIEEAAVAAVRARRREWTQEDELDHQQTTRSMRRDR